MKKFIASLAVFFILIVSPVLGGSWSFESMVDDFKLSLSFDKSLIHPGDLLKMTGRIEAVGQARTEPYGLLLVAHDRKRERIGRLSEERIVVLGSLSHGPLNIIGREIIVSSYLPMDLGDVTPRTLYSGSISIDAYLTDKEGRNTYQIFPKIASLELRPLLEPAGDRKSSMKLTLSKYKYFPHELIQGRLDVKAVNLGGPAELVVFLECYSHASAGGGFNLLEFWSRWNSKSPELRRRLSADGPYQFLLERDLPLKLPERTGDYDITVTAEILRPSARPEIFHDFGLFFLDEPKKEIVFVPDDSFDPPEPIPLKSKVFYKFKYAVKGLPDSPLEMMKLKETATLYREVKGTAGGQTGTTLTKLKSEEKYYDLYGVSGGEAKVERQWWLTIKKGGPHVLEYAVEIPGYAPLKRTRRFFGKEDQAALPQTDQSKDVWICQAPVLGKVDFPAYTSKTETSLTAEEEFEGKKSSNTITWTAPPKTIRDGQQITLSISAPKKKGSFIQAEYKLDRLYIKEGSFKGDVDTSTNPGSEELYGPASQTCSFVFDPPYSEFEIRITASKWNCPGYGVTWKYRLQKPGEGDQESGGQDAGGAGQDGLGPEGNVYNLFAWLEKETIELVPGDISQICAVNVKGWNPQGKAVEVLMDTTDSFGSLRVNPDIQANPATTSNSPFNIITNSAGEGAFSEMWRARSTAGPGMWQVPIRVRQNEVGEVRLLLNVRIVPKKSLPGGGPTTPPTTPGGKTAVEGRPGREPTIAVKGPVVTLNLTGFSWPQNMIPADLKKVEIKSLITPLEHKEEAWMMIQSGVEAMKKGDWNDAENIFRAGAEHFPDDLLFKLLLGHVLYAKNRMPEAMEIYRQIADKDPLWSHAHNSLGNVFFVMMNWAEATRCYREAVNTNPKNGEFWANLAGSLFMQDKRNEASTAAGRAMKLEFTPHWVYEKLGLKYIR